MTSTTTTVHINGINPTLTGTALKPIHPLETTLHLLQPSALASSPYMPALFSLINRTFSTAHNPPGHSYLPPEAYSRLRTHSQLGQEIGDEGFTWIMLATDEVLADAGVPAQDFESDDWSERRKDDETEGRERIIGTASAKPYQIPSSKSPSPSSSADTAILPITAPPTPVDATSLFKRQPGAPESLAAYADLPKWEILVTVVDPALQGRGLAGKLMDITVAEIRRRVKEQENSSNAGAGVPNGAPGDSETVEDNTGVRNSDPHHQAEQQGQIWLLLSTMQELNEKYYAKRGWVTTASRQFEKGTMGSRDGFGVVEMRKVVEG